MSYDDIIYNLITCYIYFLHIFAISLVSNSTVAAVEATVFKYISFAWSQSSTISIISDCTNATYDGVIYMQINSSKSQRKQVAYQERTTSTASSTLNLLFFYVSGVVFPLVYSNETFLIPMILRNVLYKINMSFDIFFRKDDAVYLAWYLYHVIAIISILSPLKLNLSNQTCHCIIKSTYH